MSKINETNYPRRTQANYADTDMLVLQAAGGNTYTTRLEDMREDYEATLAPILSDLQDDVNENLATIEGSTASKAYAKGDFLVFGGKLCKAKTAIAVNATLILDTNIELDSVGDELSSLSSQLANLIKVDTYSGTTNSSGYLITNISEGNKRIIGAYAIGYPIMPLVYNNVWYFLFTDPSSGTVKPATGITATVTYFYY